MNKHTFRSVLIVLFALVLGACGSVAFCIGPAGKCNSNDVVVGFTDADRQALIDALTGVITTEVANAEERINDHLDEGLAENRELATKQLTTIHDQIATLSGKLNAHDALTAKGIHDLADDIDDLALVGNDPSKWAQYADEIRNYTQSAIPTGYRAYCLSAPNGWHPYEGANVLCWGGRVQWLTTEPVDMTPVKVSEVNKLQVVPGVIGRRTTIKREGSTDSFYCRQPGKPDPHVNDVGYWLPNGDLWLNTQKFRRYDSNGPLATNTPGNPATQAATNTPGSGSNPTATPGGNTNNPTATPNVGVTPNPGGGITIVIEGDNITINNNITIELANAGITPEILALLLQNQQWQQQILQLLQNNNWSAGDIVILIINIVTGHDPVPGQYCIQVQTWSCDFGRWFPNPCDAVAAGAKVLVFNKSDCPNQVASATPGGNPTATQPVQPTATRGGSSATATNQPVQPTATRGGNPPTETPWWEPTKTPQPGQPTPAATSATSTSVPDPTDRPTATEAIPTRVPQTPGSTPGSTPVATNQPVMVPCRWTTQMVADALGLEPENLVQTGRNWPVDDGCRWNIEEGPKSIKAPFDFQLTLRFNYDGHPVGAMYGDGRQYPVLGGAVRPEDWYRENKLGNWVLDPNKLMAHEEDFGQEDDPAYHTFDVNLGSNHPYQVTKSPRPASPGEAARLMGGQPADWKDIGWTPWRPYWAMLFNASYRNGVEKLISPGYGDFDTWKWGNVRGQDLPDTIESATFNAR